MKIKSFFVGVCIKMFFFYIKNVEMLVMRVQQGQRGDPSQQVHGGEYVFHEQRAYGPVCF